MAEAPVASAMGRGVMVVIVAEENKILLHHRDDRPDVLYPGYWAGFGGAVEPGEQLDEALCRELAEETGLTLIPGEAVVISEVLDPVSGRLMTVSLLRRAIGPSDIVLGEGQGVGLFAAQELAALAIPPFLRAVIEDHVLPRLAAWQCP